MKIESFSQAVRFLLDHVPTERGFRFPGELGLKRTLYFLKLLGNPEKKLKVIHIAGTSGKGSTAYLVSLLLSSLGFKTGLTLSPHLMEIRERVQINNQNISKQKFVRYINQLIPSINHMINTRFGAPTYFEIVMALALYAFFKENVDYAVVETGLGGLYDASNAVTNFSKLVVLTRIGHDHTRLLGKTLGAIAFQKAGIIYPQNTVISIWQDHRALAVIEKTVENKMGDIFLIKNGISFKNVAITEKVTTFDFDFLDHRIPDIELGLMGAHQAENASLALAAVSCLSKRDKFLLDERKIRYSLAHAHFPGRFDIQKVNGKLVILDGAHNPQKMKSLTDTLEVLYPKKKFDFLIAFKRGKDYKGALNFVIPLAHTIFITSFFKEDQEFADFSEAPVQIKKTLKRLHFPRYKIVPDIQDALEMAIEQGSSHLVITGSLYLLGEIYPLLKKWKNPPL